MKTNQPKVKTMKIFTVTGKETFNISEIDAHTPKEDELLIELIGNTMCNQHDLAVYSGLYSKAYPLGAGFPGHEGVGKIIERGTKVYGFNDGDLVVMTGIGGPPLYAQIVTRKWNTVFKVTPPAGYAVESLACCELFGCVYHALEKIDSFEGKDVAVAGLGPGGLAAIQLLTNRNPKSITGIDINKERFPKAIECGANFICDAGVEYGDFSRCLKDAARRNINGAPVPKAEYEALLPKRRFDIIIDCSGNALSTGVSFALARTEVLVFGFTYDVIPFFQQFWFDAELVIRNSKVLGNADMMAVANLFNTGKIDPSLLITHSFKFSEYNDAINKARSGQMLKGVLSW
jgi:threonine dehydrogenase-like Zn-dependent dehydrogenase